MPKKNTAPNAKRQREARATLKKIFANSDRTFVIHYSCESFYDRPEGKSPRITSIAVRNLNTAQTVSFSIHQVAERRAVPFGKIDSQYDNLEKEMLSEYFDFLNGHKSSFFLHWNMRDVGYGFYAIENRYKVLGGEPYTVPDADKFDLSRLLIEIYGVGYIGHPRLEALLDLNNIKALDFLTGKEEADAFDNKEYHKLHRSTLRKVDVLANLATRAHDDQLTTNTTWWQMHGGGFYSVWIWVINNKGITFLLGLIGLGLGLLAFL